MPQAAVPRCNTGCDAPFGPQQEQHQKCFKFLLPLGRTLAVLGILQMGYGPAERLTPRPMIQAKMDARGHSRLLQWPGLKAGFTPKKQFFFLLRNKASVYQDFFTNCKVCFTFGTLNFTNHEIKTPVTFPVQMDWRLYPDSVFGVGRPVPLWRL